MFYNYRQDQFSTDYGIDPMQDAAMFVQRTHIDNNILYIEGEINKLVYRIYGMTDEEIAIVEDGT
jgi:hypothetical protein